MKKKYLIGYMFGRPFVGFEDIKNFKEEADEIGDVHVTFEDNNGAYHYVSAGRVFKEVDNRAPEIERYEVKVEGEELFSNGLDTAMVEVDPDEYQERQNRVRARLEADRLGANAGGDWEVEDLDYSYIDDNDTGYVGEDFLDEMLVDEPVKQVIEEQGISSPEELLDYYVDSLAEGGIGIPEEYREMLLDKIKNELRD